MSNVTRYDGDWTTKDDYENSPSSDERMRRVYEAQLLSIEYHQTNAKDTLLQNPCYGMERK